MDPIRLLEHIGGAALNDLLAGLEQADKAVAVALDAMGDGIEWTGTEVEKLAALVASLGPKLEDLKARLSSAG